MDKKHSLECDRTWKALDDIPDDLNAENREVYKKALRAFIFSRCPLCDDPTRLFEVRLGR
jgi:hypothetical protein